MERKFDGANLQYSTNLDATWTNVGAANDAVNCLNDNWFNYTPIISSLGVANNLTAGNYAVKITDNNNCILNINLPINNVSTPVSFSLGKDSSICAGQSIILSPGNYAKYLWQDFSTRPTYSVTQTGTYWAIVTNSGGCTGSDTVNITSIVGCDDIYFPNAFTPNGDHKNYYFGPVGNIAATTNYRLLIYDRWGELTFSSTDPNEKWDGNFKGKITGATSSYTWYVTYTFKG